MDFHGTAAGGIPFPGTPVNPGAVQSQLLAGEKFFMASFILESIPKFSGPWKRGMSC